MIAAAGLAARLGGGAREDALPDEAVQLRREGMFGDPTRKAVRIIDALDAYLSARAREAT